jgi:hypothetical protein
MSLRDKDEVYETPPKYVMNEEGRIFVATEQLLKKPGMSPVYEELSPPKKQKTKPVASVPIVEENEFDVGKATKQQIIDRAAEEFGVELDFADLLKDLRLQYQGLKAEANAGDNDNISAGE